MKLKTTSLYLFRFHTQRISLLGLIFIFLSTFPPLSAQDFPHGNFSIYSSTDKQKIPFSNLSGWENFRWHILQNLQEVMGPLPYPDHKEPVKYIVLDTLETEHYSRLNLVIEESKTEKIPAFLYLPKRLGSNGHLPAIIALHPTGMQGKKIVDGQGKENRGYAKELAERGYIVIAPDYITFGDLEHFDLTNPKYKSGTMAGIYYHMRCIDLLVQRNDVDKERIGAIGHSLGGHNSMFLGAFDPRVKVIVSSCGWTQFENYDVGEAAIKRYGGRLGPWAQDRYMPLIREKYNLDGDKLPFNFHEIIALLAPRAFFSNSPVNDANFDYKGVEKGISMVEDVYDFYQANMKLQVRYPDAEHDFPTEVRREAYEFLDKNLNHTPGKHSIE